MSLAAEWIRKRLLRGQITDAQRAASDAWWSLQVAFGMGGQAPDGTQERLWQAASDAERLMLEYRLSQ